MAPINPAKVKVESITQIAITVKNLELVMENYWNILGIGPWEVYDWEAPRVYDRKYHGKPSWAREKIALAQVGAVQMELVQPVDGDSIYQDFIAARGEGLHHLQFKSDDVEKTVEIFTEDGFTSLQSGRFGNHGAYHYMDIKPLRAIWEPIREASDKSVGATRYPRD